MNIKKLKIIFKNRVLVDINLTINTSLALVGQSGSGKSLTLKALLGMLPEGMLGEIDYDIGLDDRSVISFVPQNPFTALSPLTKINKQFFVSSFKQKELFRQVGLPGELLWRFPPELSGGQLQRVVIAIALESNPKLLLLDEPTTALDLQSRIMILELLKSLQKQFGFKILFVTHDISSAKNLCEDICIIKEGKVIENGKMSDILNNPVNIYTKTLIESNFTNRKFRE